MIVHTVTHFLMHGNPLLIYCIVAVMLLLESTGIPIVNSTLLLCTGALASLGHLNLWQLIFAASLGSSVGACLGYLLGAWGGRHILFRMSAFLHVDTQKMITAERWCQKSGVWMIFLSRVTPYIRPFACIFAGVSRLPFSRFIVAAASGSLVWCSAILTLGWYLGRRWVPAVHIMQSYTLLAVGMIILLVGLSLFFRRGVRRYLHTRSLPTRAKRA